MQAVHALVMRASQGDVARVADHAADMAKLMAVIDAAILVCQAMATGLADWHSPKGENDIFRYTVSLGGSLRPVLKWIGEPSPDFVGRYIS